MARLITLRFLPINDQLLLPTTALGTETLSIPLANPYPFVFPHLARTITFTSSDDLTGTNFRITGTDQFGNVISEILVGPNNETIESTLEYNTVTNISADEEYTNLSIGSGTHGTFQWVKLNTFSAVGLTTVAAEVISDAAVPIEYSLYATLDKLEFYQKAGATYRYVYPGSPVLLGDDPLTTVNDSNIVTVTVPSTAGFVNGDIVQISGAEATNGISQAAINARSMITVIDDTHFSYQAASPANADGTEGGSSVTYTLPAPPYRFVLNDDNGDGIFDRSESSLSQHEALGAIQVVVTDIIPGAGFVVNIMQQGIN